MKRALLFLISIGIPCHGLDVAATGPRSSPAKALAGYGSLPLSFEANHGQANRAVKFLARGQTYFLALRTDGIDVRRAATTIHLRFVGASPAVRIEAEGPLPGAVNYFVGNEPARWLTNLPTYARVRYRGVYPGVDVVLYGNERRLEYDFELQPGARPESIRLAYAGALGVRLDAGGDLVLKTPGGEMRQHKPRVYQEIAGVKRIIQGGYVLYGGNRVGFRLGEWDRSRPLVVDPVLTYSTYLGGNDWDEVEAVAVDASGNAYLMGQTYSVNFPTVRPAQGAYGGQPGLFTNGDAFITKLSADGTALVYSTFLGGNNSDAGIGIAVDGSGNAYVTGMTRSPNFPTMHPTQSSMRGGGNAFVAKLSPEGNSLVYSTYLGGTSANFEEYGAAVAVDATGAPYVAGVTASADFPTSPGAFQRSRRTGSPTGFVTKFAPDGSRYLYSTYLGGNLTLPAAVAVDAAGNAYVAGATQSGFPVTAGALQATYGGGNTDAFVAKLNPAGTALVYGTYLGGTDLASEGSIQLNTAFRYVMNGGDQALGVAVDSEGNAYVAGATPSRNFPRVGALQSVYGGGSNDAFVAKINAAGNALIYSTYLGGSGFDLARAIALDGLGGVYVAGWTGSVNFPQSEPIQPALGGGTDAFVAQLDASGSHLVYATYFGGSGDDYGLGIAADSSGAYVTGYTTSRDFRASANAVQKSLNGTGDGFVLKITGQEAPRVTAVASAASLAPGPIAPGEIVSVMGAGMGPAAGLQPSLVGGRVPTTASEVQVLFAGVAAPLFYVGADRIYAQAPYSLDGKTQAAVEVVYQDRHSNSFTVQVAPSAPGLFADAGRAIASHANGDLVGPASPARPGEVVTFWATGEGQTSPPGVDGQPAEAPYPKPVLPVSMAIGGVGAENVSAALAPGFAGLCQVNARVGSQAPTGDQIPVVLTVGAASSAAGLYISVAPPPPPAPTVSLTAAPDSIWRGQSSTLRWSSTNASRASIDQGIGNVPVTGSLTVSPAETTTYTITVAGAGGTASASATVRVSVLDADPAEMISPPDGSTLPGSTVTFSWTPGRNIAQYHLKVGTKQGRGDVYDSDQGSALTVTVAGIPADGGPIYVELSSRKDQTWIRKEYSYTAAGSAVVPAGGHWSGSIVSFWVAANGSKIGGAGASGITMMVTIPLGPNTTQFYLVYDEIPIQFGRFDYTRDTLEIIGRFTSPTQASGTYSSSVGNGTWQASLP
jgi:uncharacterized protein (TIGR03437 family)